MLYKLGQGEKEECSNFIKNRVTVTAVQLNLKRTLILYFINIYGTRFIYIRTKCLKLFPE